MPSLTIFIERMEIRVKKDFRSNGGVAEEAPCTFLHRITKDTNPLLTK